LAITKKIQKSSKWASSLSFSPPFCLDIRRKKEKRFYFHSLFFHKKELALFHQNDKQRGEKNMRTFTWTGWICLALFCFPNQADARYFDAGPVWNMQHAKLVCPRICTDKRLHWDGDWINIILGRASVCGCRKSPPPPKKAHVATCTNPGKKKTRPIYHKRHAKKVCPRLCKKHRCTWNGRWQTTLFGKMFAVCGCQ
jgi:hypothetical protein